MKTLKIVLAVVCGVAVLTVGVYSAYMGAKFMAIFEAMGCVALPIITRVFLTTPFMVYVLLGLIVGALLAFLIMKSKRNWEPFVITAATGVFLLLYTGLFVVAMFLPMGGIISEIEGDPATTQEPAQP